jgi:hypothetical protein
MRQCTAHLIESYVRVLTAGPLDVQVQHPLQRLLDRSAQLAQSLSEIETAASDPRLLEVRKDYV